MTANPLLLTLTIGTEAQQYFNKLRQQYFPPERNFLDAHLSLFHQLPAGDESLISDLQSMAGDYAPFKLQVTSIVSIGNGVAFKIQSDKLQILHTSMQKQWNQWLILQDQHKLWPHITIQNKVTPDVAKALITELSTNFEPFEIMAMGFSLWEYLGGPWRFIETYAFTIRS